MSPSDTCQPAGVGHSFSEQSVREKLEVINAQCIQCVWIVHLFKSDSDGVGRIARVLFC